MEATGIGFSVLAVQEVDLTATDAVSITPTDTNTPTQEERVPDKASINEDDREKGITLPASLSGRLEAGNKEASSRSNGCFSASSLKTMMPKSGWRGRSCTAIFILLLPVVVVGVFSLPTLLHFIALVSVCA